MSLNTKLDLRLEAAKIVCQLLGTTIDNFHERVYRVELYLTGDAELPEQDTKQEELIKMMQEAREMMQESVRSRFTSMHERVPDTNSLSECCLGFKDFRSNAVASGFNGVSPHGIPSSEGEALFLQRDGEKVE